MYEVEHRVPVAVKGWADLHLESAKCTTSEGRGCETMELESRAVKHNDVIRVGRFRLHLGE